MKKEILLPLVACCATLSASAKGQKAKDNLPNVVFILVDDLGYGDLGCYGQDKFRTPNIDAMAERGMQFTQAYAGCTVSAPSRTSLMTGKDMGNVYIRNNSRAEDSDGRVYDRALKGEEFTIAELFKQRDYATACVGKWGMGGPNTEGAPTAQGFDYFFGYLGQETAHNYFPDYLHENNELVMLNGKSYSHELMEQKALSFIEENKENPFFLYLTFTIPHAELRLPESEMKYVGDFEETPFEGTRTYAPQTHPRAAFASMIERLDLSVGRVNDLLAKLNIADNTLVIFSSDNGAHREGGADPDFFNSTGPLRGIKRDLYEGGIRVPMLATWGDKIPRGVKNDAPIAFWDMLPTFAELIDVEAPEGINGISMLKSLRGKKAPVHDYLYWAFYGTPRIEALRDGDWKLLKFTEMKAPRDSYFELYNIAEDISEQNNVAEKNPEIVERLKAKMDGASVESEIFKF